MAAESDKTYGLPEASSRTTVNAPNISFAPSDPKSYRPSIGLIGCGGITVQHLTAYKSAGYKVVALCDIDERKARAHQRDFYPDATVHSDYHDILSRDDIEVVDVATHPSERSVIFGKALEAGKHILSQKPFVLDLDFGKRIVDEADRRALVIAVNQNGRWAPHWRWISQAIAGGLVGDLSSVHLAVNWNHNWIAGSSFEEVRDLVLYDFAIHWFDIVSCFMGGAVPRSVFASTSHSPSQKVKPDMLAQATIEYADAQASLFFDANTLFGERDETYVSGTKASIRSSGPDLNSQEIVFATAEGVAKPSLSGAWFPDGFHGTMGELLCAIEEGREPENSARANIRSLELCFAAVESSRRHQAVVPGSVTLLPL